MKRFAMGIGILALVGTIVPPALFMVHALALEPMQWAMFVSCVAWFITAPMWMKSE